MRAATVALTALLLTGCGGKAWTKAAFTDAEFSRDTYECQRDSQTYGGGSGIPGALMILAAQRQSTRLYESCMQARGWQLVNE